MPNSKQTTPDPIDEDRESPRPSNQSGTNNNNMELDIACIGLQHAGPQGIARRDENSISFRHFLQPHSDVVPPPAPTCRSRNRGAQPGSVDLVDMAMALPDFVQDHLVVESLAIAENQNDGTPSHSGASLDLSVLNEILPDFATSQSPHTLPSQSGHPHPRRRNIPEESPSVADGPLGAAGSSALPDFLSDGPMQCTDTNVADNNICLGPTSSRPASRLIASSSLAERSRIVDESSRSTSFDSSETLRSEVERLRREVAERNRRISHLESEIVRLRTNSSVLENALRSAEQNAIESEGRRLVVQKEANNLKHLLSQNDSNDSSGDGPSSSGVTVNGAIMENSEMDPRQLRAIAQSSEALISQLLQNMTRLRGIASAASHRTEEHKKISPDEGSSNN